MTRLISNKLLYKYIYIYIYLYVCVVVEKGGVMVVGVGGGINRPIITYRASDFDLLKMSCRLQGP